MAKVYANLIMMGRVKIEDVPALWQDQVQKILNERRRSDGRNEYFAGAA